MAEYINKQELLKEIDDLKKSPWYNDGYGFGLQQARHDGVNVVVDLCINQAPTVDVAEVVHAYWKETTHITESKRGREIHSKLYNCSNCDAPNGRKKSSYCHWCGAKMDGKGVTNND